MSLAFPLCAGLLNRTKGVSLLATMSDVTFEAAQDKVKSLSRKPSNDELLDLYALFKQATQGDVSGKRPGLLDLRGRAKFDAWSQQRGKSSDACKAEYIVRVEQLGSKYGFA